MKRGLHIVYLISLLTLAACMNPPPSLVSATDNEDFGIGGTGILAEGFGIGGTGIIGEVTGFGSIFVNGIEIETDAKTRFTVNGKPTNSHRFQIGEIVEVVTLDDADYTRARHINIRHEIIGPVDKVNSEQRQLSIFGQIIRLNRAPAWPVQPGQYVAVSGYRDRTDTIQATHIALANSTEILLRGNIQVSTKGYHLFGRPVHLPAKIGDLSSPRALTGYLADGTIRVTRVDENRRLPFENIQRWRIQGYPADYAPLFGIALTTADTVRGIFEVKTDNEGNAQMRTLPARTLNKGSNLRQPESNRIKIYRSPLRRNHGANPHRGRSR